MKYVVEIDNNVDCGIQEFVCNTWKETLFVIGRFLIRQEPTLSGIRCYTKSKAGVKRQCYMLKFGEWNESDYGARLKTLNGKRKVEYINR